MSCCEHNMRYSLKACSSPDALETRQYTSLHFFLQKYVMAFATAEKYRCGRSPVSKIPDNEHSTASLGDSEILSVQDSVGKMIPAVSQRLGKGTEVDPAVRGQASGNVFPKNPARCNFTSQVDKVEGQSAALSRKSGSLSGDGEVLTGSSPDQNVNCSTILPPVNFRHVADIGHVWVVMRKHGTGKPFDLGKGDWLPSERSPRNCRCLNTGTNRKISQLFPRALFMQPRPCTPSRPPTRRRRPTPT